MYCLLTLSLLNVTQLIEIEHLITNCAYCFKITHRRLAARNILLTYLNEVKIYGFGPQPEEEYDGDAENGKKVSKTTGDRHEQHYFEQQSFVIQDTLMST
ncbi:hypothetical protein DPMN_089433 [Dreissena polymorpha]|uniref:Uncharacterized protein n=1 Tax=Dreissena polymorpha TaxID=45954 RepID=A0A9D4KWS2_DREPO|nr:hypothetical protein DPMN_089433 [Dreissena polymorpha]